MGRVLLPASLVSPLRWGTAPVPSLDDWYGGCCGWNISSQRGSGSPVLAACSLSPAVWWHPASLPSLWASLRPLAVPVSANSGGTKRESLRQHHISAAALGPARPDWISNWITVPTSESVRGSGTPGRLSLLWETLVSAVLASLGLASQMGKPRPQEGERFAYGYAKNSVAK